MDEWIDGIPSVLMAWYPGERGGVALARILAGQAVPGGRLPVSIPRETNQLPHFDPFVDTVTYGYFHGYTWHYKTKQEPRFPFGFGLDYTTNMLDTAYLVSAAQLTEADTIELVIELTNTGTRSGWAIPQAYVAWPDEAARPDGVLQAFAKTSTIPGVKARVSLSFPVAQLRNYAGPKNWVSTPGRYKIYVGFDAEDARSTVLEFDLVEAAM